LAAWESEALLENQAQSVNLEILDRPVNEELSDILAHREEVE